MSDEPEREPIRRERERSRSPSEEREPRRERDRSRSRERQPVSSQSGGCTLYVSNLPNSSSDTDLKEFFAKIGKVVHSRVVTDPHTGDSRGFGFVEMESAELAEKAMHELHQSDMNGRLIVVERAKRNRPHKSTPGRYLGAVSEKPRDRGSRDRFYQDRRYDGYGGPPPPQYDRYDSRYDRDYAPPRPEYYEPPHYPRHYEDDRRAGGPMRGSGERSRFDPYPREPIAREPPRDPYRESLPPPTAPPRGYYR